MASSVFLGNTVSVSATGAIDGDGSAGDPLAVAVDGDTITIVDNELVASAVSSIWHQATVELTDAQVKALPTTPVPLVAAPGDNLLVMPEFAFDANPGAVLVFDWTANYTNVDASADIVFTVGNCHIDYKEEFFFAWGEDAVYVTTAQNLRGATGYGPASVAQQVNQPLTISVNNNGDGVFTGGNAANTVTVAVTYRLLNIATGLYV